MSESSDSNGTNAKAFGGVIAIVAVIAGIAAMFQPMNQRIDFLERQVTKMTDEIDKGLTRIKAEIESHEILTGHPGALQLHSQSSERFKEVETQFEALEQIQKLMSESHEKRLVRIESHRFSEEDRPQWERIRSLEREVYGEPQPVELSKPYDSVTE